MLGLLWGKIHHEIIDSLRIRGFPRFIFHWCNLPGFDKHICQLWHKVHWGSESWPRNKYKKSSSLSTPLYIIEKWFAMSIITGNATHACTHTRTKAYRCVRNCTHKSNFWLHFFNTSLPVLDQAYTHVTIKTDG